jgi:single-strand DNA-binding protein
MSTRGVNRVIALGTVGKAPETRFTQSGKPVTTVSIAVNESWVDKQSGQKQESTEWINLVFFDKLAEIVQQYVGVGSKIYVDGKLKTRKWDKDGVTHYRTDVVCDNMQMLDSKPQDGQAAPRQAQPARQAPAQAAPYDGFDADLDF